MIRALLALLALAAWGAPAAAHLMPNSVISLDFGRAGVSAEILMPVSEFAYATGVPPPQAAAAARRFVAAHLAAATPDGRPWRVAVGGVTTVADAWNTDLSVAVALAPPPGASPRRLTFAWDGIIDRVANHFVLVFVRSDFATGTLAAEPELVGGLQGSGRTLAIDRGSGSAWRGFAASLRLGMAHIAEGHDHLLFLFALILPAPLVIRGGRWAGYGGARRTIRRLALVVSAFTIGHSLTLIGGAVLGWQLPARPVEVGIALSILVSAVQAWRPVFGEREAWLAGGFGLVHGLAFATVIGNFRLDPLAKAQSILGFNLGIELVQLAVVAAVLPLLLILARSRHYALVRNGGAIVAGAAALAWIEERATGTANGVGGAIDAALGHAPVALAVATAAALAWRYARPRAAAGGVAGA